MKLTIKQINTEIFPRLQQLDDNDPQVKQAKEAFFAQYGHVYADERFKQLNEQLDANRALLRELELKQQYRENIQKLNEAIGDISVEIQPVKTDANIPTLPDLFVKPVPAMVPVKDADGVIQDVPATVAAKIEDEAIGEAPAIDEKPRKKVRG